MSTKGTLLKDFGGKDRYLWYNGKSWREFGDRCDVKIRIAHFQEDLLETSLPLSALLTVLWAGLLHAEPDLTEDQVDEWLHEDNIADVLTAFFSRFAGTSPEVVEAVATKLGVEVPELDATGT